MKPIRGAKPVTALLLASQLAACMTWRPISREPHDYFSSEKPAWLRVEMTDGRRILIDAPFIVSDTIAGIVRPGDDLSGPAPGTPIRIALSDVHLIEEHGVNAEGTVATLLVIGLTIVLMTKDALEDGVWN